MTGNPHLPPHVNELVQRQLVQGHFQSENDVLSAALELLVEQAHDEHIDKAFERAFGMWKGRYQDGLEYQRLVRSDEQS